MTISIESSCTKRGKLALQPGWPHSSGKNS